MKQNTKAIVIGALLIAFSALGVNAYADDTKQKPFFNAENQEEMKEAREQCQEALSNGDYESWKNLIIERPRGEELLEKVNTEDAFEKFAEAHKIRMEAKELMTQSSEIMTELGFEKGKKFQGKGQGMHKGFGMNNQ